MKFFAVFLIRLAADALSTLLRVAVSGRHCGSGITFYISDTETWLVIFPIITTTHLCSSQLNLQKVLLGSSKPEIRVNSAVPTSQKAKSVAFTKTLLNFV
jgi:hypothetical protein